MNAHNNKLITMMAAAAMLLASSAFSQVVRISKDATLPAHQDVRLGDIATITGTDEKTADRLANLVILPNLQEARTVRAEAILMAIIAQVGPGKLADSLEVTGSSACDVKLDAPLAKPEPAATVTLMQQAPAPAPAAPSTPAPTAAKQAGTPTLSKQIVAKLQEQLRTSEDDLRVSFTSITPMLDTPVPAGKSFVITPLTRTFVGSVQFDVQLVEGSRILQRFNVSTQVLKRERILLATVDLSKGDVLTPSNVRSDEAWLDRQLPTLIGDEKTVLGMEALRPIQAGAMLDQRDFRPIEMAARSEAITVYFIRGNLRVQTQGTALQSGKLHDSIQVRNANNETYQATLIGKRLAVVGQIDDKLEQQLRETR